MGAAGDIHAVKAGEADNGLVGEIGGLDLELVGLAVQDACGDAAELVIVRFQQGARRRARTIRSYLRRGRDCARLRHPNVLHQGTLYAVSARPSQSTQIAPKGVTLQALSQDYEMGAELPEMKKALIEPRNITLRRGGVPVP
jgi:hypothetical protein